MKTQSPSGSRGRAGIRISNLPPWLSLLCMVIYIKEEPTMQIRVLKTLDISNPHSMASVLPSRHSSCTQFSVPSRAECRQVTPCRVLSASGTKAGTTLKTFFKLRALSFRFCPKGRGGTPLQAQYRRKRPFRNSSAFSLASRQLQSQVNQRGRLSCWLKNRRSQLFVVRG